MLRLSIREKVCTPAHNPADDTALRHALRYAFHDGLTDCRVLPHLLLCGLWHFLKHGLGYTAADYALGYFLYPTFLDSGINTSVCNPSISVNKAKLLSNPTAYSAEHGRTKSSADSQRRLRTSEILIRVLLPDLLCHSTG